MPFRNVEITALLISPNREIADQFSKTLAITRAFQVIGDLKTYPTAQVLDMRLRQLRPDVVLLDVASDLDSACSLIRHLAELQPPIHVVGLHTTQDSDAILKTIRAGCTEFLWSPFEVSIQQAAISRIQEMLQPESLSDKELGKIVVFSSTKPGSGASTLAVQTAFALRRTTGKRVLLVDFDMMGGSVAFYLKLDSTPTIADLLHQRDRFDPASWAQLIASTSGIHVLPAPDLPHPEPVEPNRLHEVLQYARMMYDWVVVDLPSIFHRVSLLTVSESDRAFLISTSELASLHLARKAVKLLNHLGFDSQRYQILINRVDKRDGFNSNDLTKLFDCRVDASLPNDYFSLHRVITLGEPLDTDSELGKAIDGLVVKLSGAVASQEKRGSGGLLHARPAYSPV